MAYLVKIDSPRTSAESEAQRYLAASLPEGWIVTTNIYEYRFPGRKKRELDCLVISPRGVVVIDFKNFHGVITPMLAKPWSGLEEHLQNPLEQGQNSIYAIRDLFRSYEAELANVVWIEWLIVLTNPNATLQWDSSDFSDELRLRVAALREAHIKVHQIIANSRKTLSAEMAKKMSHALKCAQFEDSIFEHGDWGSAGRLLPQQPLFSNTAPRLVAARTCESKHSPCRCVDLLEAIKIRDINDVIGLTSYDIPNPNPAYDSDAYYVLLGKAGKVSTCAGYVFWLHKDGAVLVKDASDRLYVVAYYRSTDCIQVHDVSEISHWCAKYQDIAKIRNATIVARARVPYAEGGLLERNRDAQREGHCDGSNQNYVNLISDTTISDEHDASSLDRLDSPWLVDYFVLIGRATTHDEVSSCVGFVVPCRKHVHVLLRAENNDLKLLRATDDSLELVDVKRRSPIRPSDGFPIFIYRPTYDHEDHSRDPDLRNSQTGHPTDEKAQTVELQMNSSKTMHEVIFEGGRLPKRVDLRQWVTIGELSPDDWHEEHPGQEEFRRPKGMTEIILRHVSNKSSPSDGVAITNSDPGCLQIMRDINGQWLMLRMYRDRLCISQAPDWWESRVRRRSSRPK